MTTTITIIQRIAILLGFISGIVFLSVDAFQPFALRSNLLTSSHTQQSCSALFMGKTRKARRTKKAEQSRPKNFFDAIDDANDIPIEKKPKKKKKDERRETDDALTQEELEREKRMQEAQARMDQRPDVSTMIVDDETGIEVVAQGKSVMDVVTRKAVKLSDLGAMYRLAQMFPGVPPDVRDKYRLDWKTATVPEMVEALRKVASVNLPDGTRDIPPHPSISNNAIDFVLANRDLLGRKMKRTLGRMQMRSMYLGNKEEAIARKKLWKNFLTLENHISAPFRQMIMDAEGRVGPQFGNLDVKSYCNGELYERTANYLVLKGMVAHWEKKVVDADYVEKTPQTKENYMTVLSHGDPRRYLPDPPILFTLRECTQVCAMAQQMTKAFVETPELFDDLPPEVRFIERALTTKGGTALRQYAAEVFCPEEGLTPEALREGIRRLIAQLDNMQIDPYADITNILERLMKAMEVGTDDARDPYIEYLVNKDVKNGPGNFQTYTFNHEKLSLVRFLDGQYPSAGQSEIEIPKFEPSSGDFALGELFGFGGGQKEEVTRKPSIPIDDKEEVYKVPKERAAGRPHNLGWRNLLDDVNPDESLRLGKVPPGKIIME